MTATVIIVAIVVGIGFGLRELANNRAIRIRLLHRVGMTDQAIAYTLGLDLNYVRRITRKVR
jgi:hypothetical protein